MTRTGTWLIAAGLFVASGLLGVTAARADIDASGQWFLLSSVFPGPPTLENWTQTGTTLTTDTGWAGTINPASGDFSLTAPSLSLGCPDDRRDGTVAPDALSFTASQSVSVGAMCHSTSFPLTGSRYDCGNGTVDPGEQCDDGNNVSGDGCDPFCHFENCPSCDDGSPCTIDTCNAMATCGPHVPDLRPCRSAGKSGLLVETFAAANSDKLTWKWIKGQSTSELAFADPRSSATYTLCVFAGTSAAVVGYAVIPPDVAKWSAVGSTGFKYNDATGSANGIRRVVTKSSAADRAKIVLTGKGATLSIDAPPLALPLTAQLTNSATNICWSAAFDTGNILANQTGKLKAKSASP